MIDRESLIRQVRRNCNVADARFAGLHSICGLALRLRDMFKWEHDLAPWVEKDSPEVLAWIGDREELWETLLEADVEPLIIFGQQFDPFDTQDINELLNPYGLFYGAGYARGLRPTFFLADIDNTSSIDGHTVFELGHETARDLLTLPALLQDDTILIRKECARLFLWDQIVYINPSGRQALTFALSNLGIDSEDRNGLRQQLDTILINQKDTFIYHELGEVRETVFDREIWRELISQFPQSPIELLIRAIKDLLADTNEFGTLHHIIMTRNTAALSFYVAFLDGLHKELLSDLIESFPVFMKKQDWQVIQCVLDSTYASAKKQAETIIDIQQKGKRNHSPEWIEDQIRREFLEPMGLSDQ